MPAAAKAPPGWAAVLWLPLTLGTIGLLLLADGLRGHEDEADVRAAAAAFLRDVQAMEAPGEFGPAPPLEADLRSVRITGDAALVRVTLRDGPHTLRAEVRLRKVGGVWRGRAIDLPDTSPR